MKLTITRGQFKQRALAVAALTGMITFIGAGALIQGIRPAGSPLIASDDVALGEATAEGFSATRQSIFMSPAQAAVSGNPTILYFYPFEMCQIRYCRQPAGMAAQLREKFGESVDFVAVTTYAGRLGGMALANWDLYLVPPYDEWVPEMSDTVFGVGLNAPVVVLVDEQGHKLGEFDEFLAFDQITGPLSGVASGGRN